MVAASTSTPGVDPGPGGPVQGDETMQWMKRLIPVATLALLTAGIGAAPAAADQGYETPPFASEYDRINPCTGERVTIYYEVTAVVHEHENVFILNIVPHKTSSWTSDGYVAVPGIQDIRVGNQGGFTWPQRVSYRNPEGSVIQYQQMLHFNANTGELVVADFGERVCLRP
jgi:hypothetical protein